MAAVIKSSTEKLILYYWIKKKQNKVIVDFHVTQNISVTSKQYNRNISMKHRLFSSPLQTTAMMSVKPKVHRKHFVARCHIAYLSVSGSTLTDWPPVT